MLKYNSVSNNKILELSKLKAFADNNLSMYQRLKFSFVKGRRHCGKRKKCWLQCFEKASSSGSLKDSIVW